MPRACDLTTIMPASIQEIDEENKKLNESIWDLSTSFDAANNIIIEKNLKINHDILYERMLNNIDNFSIVDNIEKLCMLFALYYDAKYIYKNNETILFALCKNIEIIKNVYKFEELEIKVKSFIKVLIICDININHINNNNKKAVDYLNDYLYILNTNNRKKFEDIIKLLTN